MYAPPRWWIFPLGASVCTLDLEALAPPLVPGKSKLKCYHAALMDVTTARILKVLLLHMLSSTLLIIDGPEYDAVHGLL